LLHQQSVIICLLFTAEESLKLELNGANCREGNALQAACYYVKCIQQLHDTTQTKEPLQQRLIILWWQKETCRQIS